MAKAAGFTCDRPGCNLFAVADTSENAKAVPDGWHILFLNGDSKHESRKELCSDFCVAMLAIERFEVNGATFRRAAGTKGKGTTEGKTYRKYTPDEKREIVRLAREEGKSATEIADAFDMPKSSVMRILTMHNGDK